MWIASALREQMLAWVQACLPDEACGLVGGLAGEAHMVLEIENELHSPVRYRMRAEAQLRAFGLLEAQNLELVAIFHSHPAGPPVPSRTDIAEAYYPEVLTLIWAPEGSDWSLRGFWIVDGQVREELLSI